MPIPSGESLDAISTALLTRLAARAGEPPIVERFVDEAAALLPLPATPFEAAELRVTPVSRSALVKLAGAHYSVWTEWARRDVRAHVGVERVVLVGPDGRRVEHPRQAFGGRAVDGSGSRSAT